MNIFITNDDPVIAARELCDKHVRSKMQIEGAIMLAHAFDQVVLNHPSTPRSKTGNPRKSGKGYYNHQCSIWARESKANFKWLVDHTLEMFDERMYRWPNSHEHFTKTFIKWCDNNINNTNITNTSHTQYAVAINGDCDCRKKYNDFDSLPILERYQAYIKYDKPFASWTRRSIPEWY